jgi:branched-chain amino acid transport system ATP-binding protein
MDKLKPKEEGAPPPDREAEELHPGCRGAEDLRPSLEDGAPSPAAGSGPPSPRTGRIVLELDRVHTFHGSIEALKGVSLQVEEGEVAALLGANGAGKSTTLSSIAGLTPPRSGRVLFYGEDVSNVRTEALAKRGLVLVPEGRRIFPALTVRENLLMGAFLRRDRRGIQEDMDWMLGLFPILGKRLRQDGGTLSGGEQQMLAIARGLMGRPRLLLLDEPSLGLAPIVIRSIFETIGEINRSRGVTILLVEQNAGLALASSGRAYIMSTGRVAVSGRSRDLLSDGEVRRAYLGG